jgi:hypothetical protein
VSFLQALLSIFQREVEQWETPDKRLRNKLSPAAEALAETLGAAANAVDEKPAEKPPAEKPRAKAAPSQAPKRGSAKARRRR